MSRDNQADRLPPHDPSWRDSKWRSRVRARLLDWYRQTARRLPWRDDPTPYRVWVSEIMLQQTQVATVIPYYQRFMKSFPTVSDLAAADPQRLLSLWEGLGYYRRARSLQAAAQQIVATHEGEFPTRYDDVIKLPGIGRYTAGAILSISTAARLPVLEGNTQRVFSRWAAVEGDPGQTANNRLLWEIATAMLPRSDSGTFNQAAMELGALVCTPKNPDCPHCPVKYYCRAHRDQLQDRIPGKVTRTQYQDRIEYAFLIAGHHGSPRSYLLRQLPDGGRWAGLWDFPRDTAGTATNVRTAATQLAEQIGGSITALERIQTIKHAVTRYRIRLHVHHARMSPAVKPTEPWRFVSLAEMERLPMSVTGRQIAEMVAKFAD